MGDEYKLMYDHYMARSVTLLKFNAISDLGGDEKANSLQNLVRINVR